MKFKKKDENKNLKIKKVSHEHVPLCRPRLEERSGKMCLSFLIFLL
jgi:hypothetical protein